MKLFSTLFQAFMKMLGVGAVLSFVILVFFLIFAGGFALQYDINFWAHYLGHPKVQAPLFPCLLAGFFLGRFSIPIFFGTWVFSFFI